MNIHYYSDTASLYIDLSENKSTESSEVAPGVVLDFDEEGQLCGVDIDCAQHSINSGSVSAEGIENYLLSKSALAKDWLRPEEDEAWQHL